jgi:SAM-dependent methyltransferase
MTPPDPTPAILAAIRSAEFVTASFAGATRAGPSSWVRVTLRPVAVRGERVWQVSRFDGRKTATENVGDPTAVVTELLALKFAGVHVTTTGAELDLRTTKKGAQSLSRKAATVAPAELTHNRVKDVPLPEGRADRVLEVMGVTGGDGRVKPTMRAKYTQINEFLKQLSHGLAAAGLRELGRPLAVLDCGCGASYLTIAAHHYLNDVLGVPAKVLGVDVNDEVIRKSVTRAGRLPGADLAFDCRAIGAADVPADVVLALHACDTATDDALAQAVRSGARLILSVPCCHHALNAEVAATGPAEPLAALLRHGILHERAADLVTDALRAAALRVMGYRTDVVEFVSGEHTARNLMIRATLADGPTPGAATEYVALRDFWGITPAIERRLGAALADRLTHPAESRTPVG